MKAYPLLFLSLLALCACNGPDTSSSTARTPSVSPPASTVASAAPIAPAETAAPTHEDAIAAIRASGKTGLWSDHDGICAGRRGHQTLMWNVASTPSVRTSLYKINADGSERLIARGSAVGASDIGRWVRPGMTFVLRAQGTSRELGRLVVAAKHC